MEQVALVDPKVRACLAALRDERVGDSPERDQLHALVDELDQHAWDIQDQVEQGTATREEYLDAFARARAASAVWFALGSDPLEATLECVYGSQAATDDLAGVRTVLSRD